MNQQIEDNLIMGLANVFTAHGWINTDIPQTLSQRVVYLSWGLHHGEAVDYYSHLSKIIKTCEQTDNWYPFTSIYVYGIQTLLDNYADFNDLYDIPKTELRPETALLKSVGNVFRNTQKGQEVIKRLHQHNGTVLRYDFITEYGITKLKKDLRKIFPKGNIRISTDTFVPDQIREWLWDEGVKKMTVYYPMKPIVVVTNGLGE